MADPTMDFLERLDDPAFFVKVDDVPVFRAHQRKGNKGDTVKVSEGDLDEILRNTRDLETEDGVVGRMTLGHTIPGAPQTQQPIIAGYVRFRSVGKFGPGGKTAIKATAYYDRRYWEEAKSYPYRSAEYYPPTKTLVGVALLKTDPMLDMGMVAYARDDNFYLIYEGSSMADPVLPPDKNEPGPDDKPQAPPGPEGVDPKFHEDFVRCAKHHFPKLFEAPEPPAPAPAVPPPPAPAAPPTPFGRGDSPLLYDLQSKLKAVTTKLAREECGRLCDALDLRYDYDRADLIERLMPLDDKGREAKIASVMRYAKLKDDPTGGPWVPTDRSGASVDFQTNPTDADVITPRHQEAALAYCRAHPGAEWEEGVEKTKATAGGR